MAIMICIHHNDPDGFLAGAAVKYAFDTRKKEIINKLSSRVAGNFKADAIEFVSADYGQTHFFGEMLKHDTVIMVDFSLQPFEQMVDLSQKCNLIWCDHHDKAVKSYKEYIANGGTPWITNLSEHHAKKSGCELTWEHFMPGKPAPDIFRAIGDYDTYRTFDTPKWDIETVPCCLGFIGANYTIGHLADNFDGLVEKFVNEGRIIRRYISIQDNEACKRGAFTIEWEGMKWAVLNSPHRGSIQVESFYKPDNHDGTMVFFWNGKHYSIGLYTQKAGLPCFGEIAQKYGLFGTGGGGEHAARFRNETFPPTLPRS
jgi:hypothetical protein